MREAVGIVTGIGGGEGSRPPLSSRTRTHAPENAQPEMFEEGGDMAEYRGLTQIAARLGRKSWRAGQRLIL